jgi:hypothetical protein
MDFKLDFKLRADGNFYINTEKEIRFKKLGHLAINESEIYKELVLNEIKI